MTSMISSLSAVNRAGLFEQRFQGFTSLWICGAIILISSALFTILSVGPLAYIVIFPAALILVISAPQFSLIMTFCAVYLQSLLIAIMMTKSTNEGSFQASQALSLILMMSLSLGSLFIIINKLKIINKRISILFIISLSVIMVIILYSILGANRSSLSSVAAYARLYLLLPFGIFIGFALRERVDRRILLKACIYLSIVSTLIGLIEFLFPIYYYSNINIMQYLNMKYQGSITIRGVDELISMSTRSFLNISGNYGLDTYLLRPNGPNIHPISYAYCLAFGAIASIIERKWAYVIVILPVIVLVGSKGAMLLVISAIIINFSLKIFRNNITGLVFFSMSTLYVGFTLLYGAATSDYHYLGLRGSMIGFVEQPWGHGIGIGGNLSDLGRSDARDFMAFRRAGAADFALESGVGVVLYQMGVLGFAFLYLWYRSARMLIGKARHAPLSHGNRRACILLGYGFLTILVNSLFQEEGLSPAALGIWGIFVSIFLAQVSDAESLIRKSRKNENQAVRRTSAVGRDRKRSLQAGHPATLRRVPGASLTR